MSELDESEREELIRLRQEVATLQTSNDALVLVCFFKTFMKTFIQQQHLF